MEFGRGDFEFHDRAYPFERAYSPTETDTRVLLGLPQWAVPEWKRNFYSEGCAQRDFLREYGQRLQTVELSSTYYTEVREETIDQWRSLVSSEFRFLPKWPKRVTHDLGLKVSSQEIKSFLQKMERFGENLGTTLLQLPPSFSIDYRRELHGFLSQIPDSFPLCVEFRHGSWFESNRAYGKLETFFVSKNLGMAISDTPGRRDVFHLSFTGERNIIRYLSDQDEGNDRLRLEAWKHCLDQKSLGSELYFVLHRPDNENSPNLIGILSPETMDQIKDLNLGPQRDLFTQ